jgi:hypothetical protein
MSDTVLEGYHQRTILAKFGFIWFRCFRGEDLNVIVYLQQKNDTRWTLSDGKSSRGLWPGELKRYYNYIINNI